MSWETEYSGKLRSAGEALQAVESGMRVFVQASSGFPLALVDVLADRAPSLRDVEIVHLLTVNQIRTAEPQFPENGQGTVSRIVPVLNDGAGVVTTRADVDFVAAEFAVVDLWGKTVRDRAELLIGIAHPSFRAELYKHCESARWFQRDEVNRPALAKAAVSG